jgi:hypothetical protein
MRTCSRNSLWVVVFGILCWGPFPSVAAQLSGTRITNHGLQGVGRVAASSLDQRGETFGSVSALAIRDWHRTEHGYTGTFLTLPDRGFNMDGFYSDYAARLHTLSFTFVPQASSGKQIGKLRAPGDRSQDQIRIQYRSSSLFEFSEGRRTTGLDPGRHSVSLFGTELPFLRTQRRDGVVVDVQRVAVDAEGLVIKADGSGWFSDEYGPNLYHFDRSLRIDRVIVPPEDYRPMSASGSYAYTSTNDPVRGRRMNQGFEALGMNPAETRLYALVQSALIQDSGPTLDGRRHARLLIYDVSRELSPSAPVGEYVVPLPVLDETGQRSRPNKTATQSELVVINDSQLLVLCRDSSGLGSNTTNPAVFKGVILVDLREATNLAGVARSAPRGTNSISPGGTLAPDIRPAASVLAVDLLSAADHQRFGFNASFSAPNHRTFSEKWEGMAMVSALDPERPNDFFLFVANDNDFMTARGRMLQADGQVHDYNAVGLNSLRTEHDTVFLAYRLTIEVDSPGARNTQ